MDNKEFDASQYTRDELEILAKKLNEYLGLEINIADEMKSHYLRCKRIAEQAELNFNEAPSAMASALNATTAALKELNKQETELYNAESAKSLELAMINTLKEFQDLAPGILDKFKKNLEAYE